MFSRHLKFVIRSPNFAGVVLGNKVQHLCSSNMTVNTNFDSEDDRRLIQKPKQPLNAYPVTVEKIKTRSVLSVTGEESVDFLNQLTTNELCQLKTDACCLHTFFLNTRGRIIHDALIYKPSDDDTLFVECDISSLQALQTHLIMYRARTKIEIRSIEQDVGVWTVHDPLEAGMGKNPEDEEIGKHDTSFLEDLDLGDNVLLCRDPRMWPLGVRVLAPKEVDIGQALKTAGVKIADAPNGTYKSVRYILGVAEGNAEIGYGRSLPAEINGDYTNALALTKTNYIGWSPEGFEKFVENRILPVKFQGNTSKLTVNTPITDKKGKKRTPIGILRGIQGSCGIGLMHLPSVSSERFCVAKNVQLECVIPPYWKTDERVATKFTAVKQVKQ